MTNPLFDLYPLGTSVWYDNISRDLIGSGGLKKLVDDFAVRGVTSNPTIFEKAIGASSQYDEQIRSSTAADEEGTFFELAVDDIKAACDVLRPVYDASDGIDGYVSIEVSPRLADDTDATIAQAAELHGRVDKPNLFVKIPGTLAGLPAIEESIASGISINVTLLFSVERHMAAAEAFLTGLERARAAGRDLSRIASVASFFVSRVDSKVDKALEANGSDTAKSLLGKAAVANAKLAYRAFQQKFGSPRWDVLESQGARLQRPLWASTSTKNPAYPDTLYVTDLVGPHTVNTMPQNTVDAFADHGIIDGVTVSEGVDEARQQIDQVAILGVDFADVAHELEIEGVKAFADSWEDMLATVGKKREQLVTT